MSGCPFSSKASKSASSHYAEPQRAEAFSVEEELAFLAEAHASEHARVERADVCRSAIARGLPAPLTSEELAWAGKIAWRNHARCIGRLHWRSLVVRDRREVEAPAEIAASLHEHLALAQGDGGVRSVMTVFAPALQAGAPAPRIWNGQLCSYAGYRGRGGAVLGDPKNVELTERALALGWNAPVERGRFDLLPWIISGRDGKPELFPLEAGVVREVALGHPDHAWFAELGLRWYAVPVIADMKLRAAGTDFAAAPFNGWYMGTEIGARNLADVERYNLLPVIADKLGLDRGSARTLWQDRALVELNVAVLHSYAEAGVKLVDHHAASDEFMRFCEREKTAGREVSARWDWIVPPLSPATTPVFHTPMTERVSTPDFLHQAAAWTGGSAA